MSNIVVVVVYINSVSISAAVTASSCLYRGRRLRFRLVVSFHLAADVSPLDERVFTKLPNALLVYASNGLRKQCDGPIVFSEFMSKEFRQAEVNDRKWEQKESKQRLLNRTLKKPA